MPRATVLVLHPERPRDAGPLVACVAEIRASLAEIQRAGFEAAGADEVLVVSEPPDDTPFGARLRRLVSELVIRPAAGVGAKAYRGRGGVVVLGSGALPLATRADRSAFVAVAASGEPRALANSRYSADVVSIGRAVTLGGLPDLDADNALPRWLVERAGFAVSDLSARWRLLVDIDGPLDVLLAARHRLAPAALREAVRSLDQVARPALDVLDRVARTLADPRAEVLVAGRLGSTTLRWLERSTAARIRALIEERGLRASSRLALEGRPARPRPPASVIGMLLERDGPAALGAIVARLADAAVVDTRVLLAHRLGRDTGRWPSDEDRFASDLLRPDRIADPWLRELTEAAVSAPIPIALGGHTVVGPGVRLLAARRA